VFNSRLDRALAISAGTGLFVLGVGELVARLGEPMPLWFWLPTLWGGCVLIFAGGLLVKENIRLARVLVLLGCAVGFLPSVWTLVMPAVLTTLAIRTVLSRPVDQTLTQP
jgi:hypothetical protein